MEDNRDSYLVNTVLNNYEEPLDISLISNNPFIPLIGNNFNTPTNQNNEKRHLLPESTPDLPPNLNNKTPVESKSIQELEDFTDQKCNELTLGSLKRDAEMKQNISQELEAHCNASLVKSLKEETDILQREVYFLREEPLEKTSLFKILMKSKISDYKCHNIDTNKQNYKIPESAPSEQSNTTANTNRNNKENSINKDKINKNNNYNHKNISKNDIDKKINNDNINNSMANNINSNSVNKNNNKNNSNNNKENCINSNEGNSNSNNNNNSSSKENNISSSNISSKININNINNNRKENNINSNGGNNITINKQKQTRKTAFIIGDSMVKKIDGYLLTRSVNYKYIVKVRPFLSAKTIDMLDYIKPTQRDFNPDVYLLYVGTNDLSSNKSPEQISLDILNLANSLKLDNNTVIVSSIVPRDDEKKADEFNIILEELCNANDVGMISHRNINPKRHLNRSRLHLNDVGVSLFVRNFRDFLNNFDEI